MRYLSSVILLLMFFSCGTGNETVENSKSYKENSVALSDTSKINKLISSVAISFKVEPKDTIHLWEFDYGKDLPLLSNEVYTDTVTPEKLVEFVSFPDISLKLIRISHDTLFVEIKNSNVLTQQMGTTGAHAFMSTTTFILTELDGINYVDYYFPEGDHARPGTYSRRYYDKRYKK